MKNYLAIIGTFHPKIDGATNITELFYLKTKRYKINTLIFKYHSFRTDDKKFLIISRIFKFFSFLKIIIGVFLNIRSIKRVYIQENGGYGKIYDIIFFIC